ncbi:protein kinase domain-containing protein [Dictyobacter formicarum]|uniref:non-specific serine/threonine protein kinase n=1 Tax=Dictyobacter formicarum TaxID=2778368 RepID=A0ABQ3VUC5_9CHLR|nr:protein kinase [Dictyobacter formicarum]GHO89482.1 hypothetical protein KSZ_74880 [Dictyobacter formicarum]
MKCPFCGTNNPADETFCANCGGYLDTSASSQTVGGQPGTNSNQTATPTQAAGSGSSGGTGTTTQGGGHGTSSTLTPNAKLQNSRYIVEKVLGQGGMGAAVLAKDSRVSNKHVVIKELISDENDPKQRQEDVRNFEREVDTLASLDHPLIPTVTDSFQEGSRYYMVQEYAPGENLEDYMERVNKPMPEQEALTYIAQVLDILAYLGEQKPPIVHRDIKPANIIISSRDKRARLVDFGIARADEAKHAQRKQTSALGTPGYAPPEQYQGNADVRSDIYALAATLHHLVTNRDPRNYPPFNYPAARTLNKQVSPELERILEKALTLDINRRYQNALQMKQDIDRLLQQRFHAAGDTSSYLLNTSGPIPTPSVAAKPAANSAGSAYAGGYSGSNPPVHSQAGQYPANQAGYPYRANQAQRPQNRRANQQQQMGVFPPAQPQKRNDNSYILWSFLLLIVVLIIIGALIFILPNMGHPIPPGGGAQPINHTGQTSAKGDQTTADPISVTNIKGEYIGLSDGKSVFDTGRKNADYKKQAVQAMIQGNTSQANTFWNDALGQDSSDAETHIYQENMRILSSGKPYITFVVGTVLTGPNAGIGYDNLQGAYVAQHEWNQQNTLGNVKVRLIIANTGSDSGNAATVANQIVKAAAKDPTIVGVMGWSLSSHAENASNILTAAHIPMVSATASSDSLTGLSSYFFRVAPSNQTEATVGATYAKNKLQAQKAVIFLDDGDSYSQSLGNDFKSAFEAPAIGGKVIQMITYHKDDQASVIAGLQQLQSDPGLIYFAGYSNDMATLLGELPKHPALAKTQILGGDALYELAGYPESVKGELHRLHFTAFAYPDEWDILKQTSKKPAFFKDYTDDYSSSNPTGVYGFRRPANNVILSYDAMTALLSSAKQALHGGTALKSTDLQQALTGVKNLQGVSGQITFGQNGDPVDKAVVVLYFDELGRIHMENDLGTGKFLAQ